MTWWFVRLVKADVEAAKLTNDDQGVPFPPPGFARTLDSLPQLSVRVPKIPSNVLRTLIDLFYSWRLLFDHLGHCSDQIAHFHKLRFNRSDFLRTRGDSIPYIVASF
jgi:hypothetical protein